MILAQGANYTITLVAGAAVYIVTPRPDLSRDEMAALSRASINDIQRVCDNSQVRGIIVDQRKMNGTPGPKTEQVIAECLAIFERKPKPTALLISDRPALRMQMTRLLTSHAPTQGRLLHTLAQAHLWLSGIDPLQTP